MAGGHLQIAWTYKILGKALVISARCEDPSISRFSLGDIGPVALRRRIAVPYLPGTVVFLPADRMFAARCLDWTVSHASMSLTIRYAVTGGPGYPASRTSMDLPVSRAVVHVVEEAMGAPVVKMPTLGGSVPMYLFENQKLPVIGVPIVNHDNNQHSENENLRVGNLWRDMEIFGALLAELKW